MTRKTTKKPVARKPKVNKQPAQPEPVMVEAITPQAFKFVMELIDRADIKGADAGNVVLIRQELARVAGAQVQAPPK